MDLFYRPPQRMPRGRHKRKIYPYNARRTSRSAARVGSSPHPTASASPLPTVVRGYQRPSYRVRCSIDLMDLGEWKSVAMVRRYRKVVDERLDDVMDAFNEDGEEQISEQ